MFLLITKYFFLLIPVVFSALAQVLLKVASTKQPNTFSWFMVMALSVAVYFLAFFFYSNALKLFPISLASPVNTIAVMLLVIMAGVLIWGEPLSLQKGTGVLLGVASLLVLLAGKG